MEIRIANMGNQSISGKHYSQTVSGYTIWEITMKDGNIASEKVIKINVNPDKIRKSTLENTKWIIDNCI